MSIAHKLYGKWNQQPSQVAKFGHSLGAKAQTRWDAFHDACQRASRDTLPSLDDRQGELVGELERLGMANLGCVDASSLGPNVQDLFRQVSSAAPSVALDRDLAATLSDDVYRILKDIEPTVAGYFGSWFQPYWISFQWNSPGHSDPSSSFGWHIDDNPRQLMKIFIYLNDVEESNGAFRAFPRPVTHLLLERGFKSWKDSYRRANAELMESFLQENPSALKVLAGPAGTVLMFDNNLVHKGTVPEQGERFLTQIEVYPAPAPLDEMQVRRAISNPIVWDYPRDPATNDIAGNPH